VYFLQTEKVSHCPNFGVEEDVLLTELIRLKCDQGRPCQTCNRRGLALSCAYINSKNLPPEGNTHSRPTNDTSLQDRVGQLEQLVLSLTKTSSATSPIDQTGNTGPQVSRDTLDNISSRQNPSMLSKCFGHIDVEKDETIYVESTHWTSVIDNVRCIFLFLSYKQALSFQRIT
jgi:hypothetical protein